MQAVNRGLCIAAAMRRGVVSEAHQPISVSAVQNQAMSDRGRLGGKPQGLVRGRRGGSACSTSDRRVREGTGAPRILFHGRRTAPIEAVSRTDGRKSSRHGGVSQRATARMGQRGGVRQPCPSLYPSIQARYDRQFRTHGTEKNFPKLRRSSNPSKRVHLH